MAFSIAVTTTNKIENYTTPEDVTDLAAPSGSRHSSGADDSRSSAADDLVRQSVSLAAGSPAWGGPGDRLGPAARAEELCGEHVLL